MQPVSAIKRILLTLGGIGVILLLAQRVWFRPSPLDDVPIHTPGPASIEAGLMCPWREPAADMKAFFPGASGSFTQRLILSGQRQQMAKALGRTPTAEENALDLHRIRNGQTVVGTILTRRVKGEYGAIEVVVGVGKDGQVRGVRLQRLREPGAVATPLTDTRWLGSFKGKTRDSGWQIGTDIPPIPPEALPSARSVVEGVRSLVILLDIAETSGLSLPSSQHDSSSYP